jgi:hypothetical protein
MDNPSRLKYFFLLENYNWFYTSYILARPELASRSYKEIRNELFAQYYYQSDSLSSAIAAQGNDVEESIPECYPLQLKWAKQHAPSLAASYYLGKPLRSFRSRVLKQTAVMEEWGSKVVLEQVRKYKPDVVYVYSGAPVTEQQLVEIKKHTRLLVLQWSCALIEGFPYHLFDLVTTSYRKLIPYFRSRNIRCEEVQQAYDQRINDLVKKEASTGDVVFIGTLLPKVHATRIAILEQLAEKINIDFYGQGYEQLPADSPIRKRYKGEANGLNMYNIYSRYKIALHIPGDTVNEFAGAKRLFEVTGIGTMLLTQQQSNISEYFEEGKELLCFTDANDCFEKIKYYLAHDKEREQVAKAGQQRTFSYHSFSKRAAEVDKIVRSMIKS